MHIYIYKYMYMYMYMYLYVCNMYMYMYMYMYAICMFIFYICILMCVLIFRSIKSGSQTPIGWDTPVNGHIGDPCMPEQRDGSRSVGSSHLKVGGYGSQL